MVNKFTKSKRLVIESDFHTDESFADLFQESLSSVSLREGNVVKGEVIGFEKDLVHIDLGLKTEGVVPMKEFEITGDHETISVGDIVDVYLEKIENKSGKAVISREKAVREAAWGNIESALAEGKTVTGFICGKVKGGFTVDLQGVIAFLPGSQVDIRPIKDITPLMNVTQPFKILKIDRKQANIVISRRAILEESRMEERDEVLANIKEGVVLDGIVKNITDYGAFIDLGSFDGLLHLTDISWSRINHPSEVLSLGQQVKVMVIKYNAETKRVSLGMKQLEENPWGDIEARYPRGSKVQGKVSNIADYGAFIELEPGIEGLVHVSEMSWIKSNANPKKFLSLGQEVECVVLDVDASKHRISLGMKQCEENPWQAFSDKHELASIATGTVKNIVDFGAFVEFEGGIEGLIHVEDIAWDNQQEALKSLSKGQQIQAVVLAIDVEKERISLGLKQLESDPFEGAVSGVKRGDRVEATVIAVNDDSISVEISEGLECIIRKQDLSSDKNEQRTDRYSVGDKVEAKVVSMDKKDRKLALSIKALEIEDQKQALADLKSQDSGTTLGDILGNAMNRK
ncbi:MAG: 30S ribosomal protein S1 [Alphaproteobacteria bacterium]|nr:30S ribosomal protein S1 [Alphaproteobacteria bacterium]OJV14161.1 MAG: 30S ribosomal protein S1 [Alphaproteobacteria bacterium 33-17]